MADLGRAALATSFLLLLYALVGGSLAAWKGRRRLAESAQNALLGSFAATVVAAAVLLGALARHDFSFQYVADHTSRELPLGYTLTAFWGGQEGSLLLWLLVLSGYSVAAVLTSRRVDREVLAWVVPTLALVGTFFSLLLVFVASPFATQAAVADGAGLNPSLQNPYMAIHPPMLYLGYVGLTVPFAFAMGALLARRTDERWIVATRRWTLAAWTFLTRSGIIQSIHSFTQSSIGPWFLGFICLITVGSLALVFARLPLLRSKTRLESLVSREATFLYNNLLLVALALTILWGVVYPILSQAVTGQAATVSKPYYNFFLHTFGIPLLLLMGIGPLVAWRRASLRALGRTFLWPLAAAVIAGIALLAAGAGSSRIGVIAYTFSVFVLASIALEFARGTAARKALGGLGWAGAFSSLIARNRRRYGGYVVHASIVLLAIGITGASAYQTVRESRLKPGQSMTVAGDRLVFRGFQSRTESNHRAIRALVDVYRGDKYLGRYTPGKNEYFAEDQVSNEVSIRHDLLTGGDLFLIADQVNSDGSVDLKALQKPLVNLLWLAGFVFVGGALIALWPDAREERRLAERYAGATVRA